MEQVTSGIQEIFYVKCWSKNTDFRWCSLDFFSISQKVKTQNARAHTESRYASSICIQTWCQHNDVNVLQSGWAWILGPKLTVWPVLNMKFDQ